ncbi:helix-turn-helix domain-containing protein [Amycolatopsis sp. NPDC059027]|uniref:helix-turn-helix domain-containing protein n=1 Tax=unclassified Amycolatopsis TaxID=2618356 RepID=UPI00366E437A
MATDFDRAGEHRREELGGLLEQGPFNVALRAAIVARGLSLDRIQDRLARKGVQVSLATLSYWQSGQRRPERPTSLRALEHLENVLEVPPNSLRNLLGPPSPRGRRGGSLPGLADLWPAKPEVAGLLGDVPTTPDRSLRRLTLHDRVLVGPDGRERAVRCTQVMRADCGGPDRALLVYDWDGSAGEEPVVTGLRNCTLGKVVTSEVSSLFAAELLFERPLTKGEHVLIEFEVHNPRREHAEPATTEAYFRRFRRSVREYLLEVCFDPAAVPRRCQHFTSPPGDTSAETAQLLKLGLSDSVLALGRDVGPGHFGIRWYY